MAVSRQISGHERVNVERDRCVGAGQCVLAAPAVFGQDDEDGLVLVLAGQPAQSQAGAVREAVWTCPSGALTLR
ncbi:ferredoxin [Streptomyces sp. NPDC006976]|uniref:ferredoxin n=1 Tax=unclassified Streptomyces TaxID=2593676 RepID=UPI0033F09ADE